MLAAIGSAWKTHLKTAYPPTDRLYMDFRKQDYPDLGTGSAAYTLAREDNLVDNGNCESATAPALLGLTPAANVNCTFARSSDVSRSGDYSYKHTKTVAAGSGSICYVTPVGTTNMSGFKCGEVCEIECYINVPAASGIELSECHFSVIEYDDSVAAWGTLFDSTPAAGSFDTWVKVSGSFTIPSDDITGVAIRFYTGSTAANAEYFYVDDIIIKRHSVPGSHYLSSGYIQALCEMPEKFTLRIKFHPTFAYSTGSNQLLCGWYGDADSYFSIYYNQATDKFRVYWYDGGTARELVSAQYDNGTTYRNINQWIELIAAIDLSTGTTAGSALYMNGTQDETSWSGNIDAKATVFNKLQIRAYNGTTGAYDIAYCELIPNYVATASDVANDFKTVYNERIWWSLDGHGLGRTRCKIPIQYVAAHGFEKGVAQRVSGAHSANNWQAVLHNNSGQFSDDQYAAFDPTSAQYNGTVDQKYLQRRCRVWCEEWYGGDWDTTFFGRLTTKGFARNTQYHTISTVSIIAADMVEQLHTYRIQQGGYWEDTQIADATEADSLMHLVARCARPRVYNLLSNSSFENATIGNSWVASGGSLTRESDPLLGTYSGQLDADEGSDETVVQTVLFDGIKKLNVGEAYTLYLWFKSSGAVAAANGLILGESDSGGSNDTTTANIAVAGGEGWVKHEVTHTITDSDSDRLVVTITVPDGDVLLFDCAHLVHGARALNVYCNNTDDGDSGEYSADNAASVTWDIHGFDVEPVDIEHPWKRVEQGESVWSHLSTLADACGATYLGMTECGTLKFRAMLATGYADKVPYMLFDDGDIAPGVATNLTMATANKIIGHGAKITKDAAERALWFASASRSFDTNDAGYIEEAVADGATWPSSTTYGVYYAKYDGAASRYKDTTPYIPPTFWQALGNVIDRIVFEPWVAIGQQLRAWHGMD